jgi:hypothetical protein
MYATEMSGRSSLLSGGTALLRQTVGLPAKACPFGSDHAAPGRVALAGVALVACLGLTASAFAAAKDRGPADRFVASLGARAELPAQAAELIRTRWAECTDCDPEEFLTQGLTVLSDEFRAALDAYDSDDYAECAARCQQLAAGDDPFVAVNAAAYEIKALVALDQTLEAGDRIVKLTGDDLHRVSTYSYFAPEMAFLKGYCLLADLQYDPAAMVLNSFLSEYPEASPRLTIAAKQILLELANREAGKMGEVVDLMQFSGRRLKNADGGEVVQTRQQRILDLLDEMIKEAEEQEKSSCQGGAGGQSGQQSQGGQAPSNPMQDSALPGGSAAEGNLGDARRANPGESWGAMPPAERERILQALRESFPSRYRQLVEQYYEELAKKP